MREADINASTPRLHFSILIGGETLASSSPPCLPACLLCFPRPRPLRLRKNERFGQMVSFISLSAPAPVCIFFLPRHVALTLAPYATPRVSSTPVVERDGGQMTDLR